MATLVESCVAEPASRESDDEGQDLSDNEMDLLLLACTESAVAKPLVNKSLAVPAAGAATPPPRHIGAAAAAPKRKAAALEVRT